MFCFCCLRLGLMESNTGPLRIPVIFIGSLSIPLFVSLLPFVVLNYIDNINQNASSVYGSVPCMIIVLLGVVSSVLLVVGAVKRQPYLLLPYLIYNFIFLIFGIYCLMVHIKEDDSVAGVGIIFSVLLFIVTLITTIIWKHLDELSRIERSVEISDSDLAYGKMTNEIA